MKNLTMAVRLPLTVLLCAMIFCTPSFGSTVTHLNHSGAQLPQFDVSYFLYRSRLPTLRLTRPSHKLSAPWRVSYTRGRFETTTTNQPRIALSSAKRVLFPVPLLFSGPVTFDDLLGIFHRGVFTHNGMIFVWGGRADTVENDVIIGIGQEPAPVPLPAGMVLILQAFGSFGLLIFKARKTSA